MKHTGFSALGILKIRSRRALLRSANIQLFFPTCKALPFVAKSMSVRSQLLLALVLFGRSRSQEVDAARNNRRSCERSTAPTPRTSGCSIRPEKADAWISFQAKLADEAAAYRTSALGDSASPPLVLIGDSITEALRGTAIGEKVARTEGIDTVLPSAFPGWQKPLVLAISADETQRASAVLDPATSGFQAAPCLPLFLARSPVCRRIDTLLRRSSVAAEPHRRSRADFRHGKRRKARHERPYRDQ